MVGLSITVQRAADPLTEQAGTGAQLHHKLLTPITLMRGECHQANSDSNYGPCVNKLVSGLQTDTPQEQVVDG